MKFVNFSQLNSRKKRTIKKKIYDLIVNEMKVSVFTFLNFKEFEKIYFNKNRKFIYINFFDQQINCLLTYLPKKNQKILKDNLINILFHSPLKFFNFFLSPSNLFKNLKAPIDYLQLFHIINMNLINIKKKKKYNSINNIHKKVVKDKYKGVYVLYRNTNLVARKYYFNNNFKVYKKNLFFTLAVKKI